MIHTIVTLAVLFLVGFAASYLGAKLIFNFLRYLEHRKNGKSYSEQVDELAAREFDKVMQKNRTEMDDLLDFLAAKNGYHTQEQIRQFYSAVVPSLSPNDRDLLIAQLKDLREDRINYN